MMKMMTMMKGIRGCLVQQLAHISISMETLQFLLHFYVFFKCIATLYDDVLLH